MSQQSANTPELNFTSLFPMDAALSKMDLADLELRTAALVQDDPATAMRYLAEVRKNDADATQVLQGLKKSMEDTEAFQVAKNRQSIARSLTVLATQAIKSYWLAAFLANGEKTVAPMEVIKKEVSFTQITDQAAALAWATENLPAAVVTKLDMAILEPHNKALVKAKRDLPAFVKVGKRTEINLATDLSALLVVPEPTPVPDDTVIPF
jgi:hypothetical protein